MDGASRESMAEKVKAAVSGTQYACSSLDIVTGGTGNFTFRAHLKDPVDGAPSVIIKHSEPYVASSPSWKLDIARCEFEIVMLEALASAAPTLHGCFQVKSPRAERLPTLSNTLILEDLQGAADLKAYLPKYGSSLDSKWSHDLGFALGKWLIDFHQWANDSSSQTVSALRTKIGGNKSMKELKTAINIGRVAGALDAFPSVAWAESELYEQIEKDVKKMLWEDGEQLIHGDFWSGNILLQSQPPNPSNTTTVFIIDFELSQIGHRSQDLGQCLAELYCLYHFKDLSSAREIISGFCNGYKRGNTDLPPGFAFQVAMNLGIHLLVFPWTVGWATKEDPKMLDCIRFGNECLVRGWRADREWFRDGLLEDLFKP